MHINFAASHIIEFIIGNSFSVDSVGCTSYTCLSSANNDNFTYPFQFAYSLSDFSELIILDGVYRTKSVIVKILDVLVLFLTLMRMLLEFPHLGLRWKSFIMLRRSCLTCGCQGGGGGMDWD